MEITLNLSEKAIRRIQAYKILTNQRNEDVGDLISVILEEALKYKCAMALDLDFDNISNVEQTNNKNDRDNNKYTRETPIEDEIALALGDEDDGSADPEEIPGTDDAEAQVTDFGLTDEVIEKDMDIEDPEHEAKADASQAQESFPSFIAPTPDPSFTDIRLEKRKKQFGKVGKGKVTPFDGYETNSF